MAAPASCGAVFEKGGLSHSGLAHEGQNAAVSGARLLDDSADGLLLSLTPLETHDQLYGRPSWAEQRRPPLLGGTEAKIVGNN